MTLVSLVDIVRAGSLEALAVLMRASVEAGIVAGLVWGLCRVVPSLPAAVRVWLWWLVSLKLVVGLLPVPAVPLPWLPPALTTWNAPLAHVAPTPAPSTVPMTVVAAPSALVLPPSQDATPVSIPYASLWPVALLLAWCALAALHGLQLWRALGNARQLRRDAEPAPARVVSRAALLVRTFALPVMPKVLASRLTAVPLITGTLRPAILLPAASHAHLSRTELDLVLGHELAHVRRGDLVWGWVPAIASRLFFFHPLARLALREYLAAREEACDAEVLQTLDAAPADYGQLLVKLGVATTDDVLAAAGSSPTFEMLKRRLMMLDRSRTPASRWWWTMAGAPAVLLPLSLAAQPVPPVPPAPPVAPVAHVAHVAPLPPVPPAPPAVPDAPRLASDADDAPPPVPPAPAAPPAPPALQAAPPAPPAPPVPPDDAQEVRSRHNDHPWVLLGPDDHNVMSGSNEDRKAAERNRRSASDTLLWFRHNGVEYVSYDAATIQAVRDAFAPVRAVGDEMGRVGNRMGEQGNKQGALGSRQGEIGNKQAEIGAVMAKVAAEDAARQLELAAMQAKIQAEQQASRQARTDAERQAAQETREQVRLQREQLRTDRQREMAKLQAEMQALSDQQRALGEEMKALGKGMEGHGAEMKQLGHKMEEAVATAQAQAARVFDGAVSSGKATRAK